MFKLGEEQADRNSGKLGLADCVLEVENLALRLRMISKVRRILLLSRVFRSQPLLHQIQPENQYVADVAKTLDAVGPESCPLSVRTPETTPGRTGGCQKKPTVVAVMHWPKSACAVGRAG